MSYKKPTHYCSFLVQFDSITTLDLDKKLKKPSNFILRWPTTGFCFLKTNRTRCDFSGLALFGFEWLCYFLGELSTVHFIVFKS